MARNSELRTLNSELPGYAGLIRWAFERFYNEFAWTYDAVAAGVSGGQWSQWTLAALPYLRGQVLELGCGTGNLITALAAKPQQVAIGLDRSPFMLRLARRRLRANSLHAPLLQASAAAMPLAAATFDTVVATFPSEYIVAPAALAEIKRVLRPHGQVVIIGGAQFRHSNLSRRLIDLLYRVTLQRPVLAQQQPVIAQSLVARAFAAAGFSVDEQLVPFGDSADLHVITAQPQRSAFRMQNAE